MYSNTYMVERIPGLRPSTGCVATESGLDRCELAELATPSVLVAARLQARRPPHASNGSSNGRTRTERHATSRTHTRDRWKPLLSDTFWYGLVLTHTTFEFRTLNPQVLGSSPRGGTQAGELPGSSRLAGRAHGTG